MSLRVSINTHDGHLQLPRRGLAKLVLADTVAGIGLGIGLGKYRQHSGPPVLFR